MKTLLLITLLLSEVLLAEVYTKADRIKDMQEMARAMSYIETGFFYNNIDLVQDGALSLSDAIRRVQPPLTELQEKDPMTRYMNERVKFTNKISKKIDNKAKLIIERFREGDTSQAVQAYTKIMKQCMECHVQVRNW
ncbi:MAG: cytochrome C [Sulfurimonas sp.]|nr:cytochrome C [Sulfurimonas sp.]